MRSYVWNPFLVLPTDKGKASRKQYPYLAISHDKDIYYINQKLVLRRIINKLFTIALQMLFIIIWRHVRLRLFL